MAKIIRVVRENLPPVRFIGKKYKKFGHWDEWFAHGWFDILEENMGGVENITQLWENGGGYVGLERRRDGELAEYWIGMFAPAGTAVPQTFASVDFPQSPLGVCWLQGKVPEVHDTSGCRQALAEHGMEPWQDSAGMTWSFEYCVCPRYTTPDEKQQVILDYCYLIR